MDTVQDKGHTVTLQGMKDKPVTQLQELTVEQFEKCVEGNDVWATGILTTEAAVSVRTTPESIQRLLTEYTDVFQNPQQWPPHRAYDHASHHYLTMLQLIQDPTGIPHCKWMKLRSKSLK